MAWVSQPRNRYSSPAACSGVLTSTTSRYQGQLFSGAISIPPPSTIETSSPTTTTRAETPAQRASHDQRTPETTEATHRGRQP